LIVLQRKVLISRILLIQILIMNDWIDSLNLYCSRPLNFIKIWVIIENIDLLLIMIQLKFWRRRLSMKMWSHLYCFLLLNVSDEWIIYLKVIIIYQSGVLKLKLIWLIWFEHVSFSKSTFIHVSLFEDVQVLIVTYFLNYLNLIPRRRISSW